MTSISLMGVGPTGPSGAAGANGADGADGTNSPADTGASYGRVFDDNLQSDDTGFSNFNGGVKSYDSTNSRLQVTASGSAKGIEASTFSTTDGNEYLIRINVTTGTGGIRVYAEWADLLETLTTDGEHLIKFTADAGSGGFGREIIITADSADTFFINSLEIFELRADRLNLTTEELDARYASLEVLPVVHAEMFSNTSTLDTSRYTNFNGGSASLSSGQLQVTNVETARGLRVKYSNDGSLDANDFDAIEVTLDIELLGEALQVQTQWAEYTAKHVISTSGVHTFKILRTRTDSAFKDLIIAGDTGTTSANFNLNYIAITRVNTFFDRGQHITIGEDTGNTYNASTGNDFDKGIQIGYQASANQRTATVVGQYAKAQNDLVMKNGTRGIFGCASGDEQIAIGEYSRAGGWRTSAIGANTAAHGQSSTAVGTGAVSLYSHGLAVGRGAFVPSEEMLRDNENVNTVIAGQNIYFENSWGHKFNTPMSAITIGDHTPSNSTVVLHGHDAYDSRFDAWDASTTYTYVTSDDPTEGQIVQHNGKAYKTLQTSTGVEPNVTSGWETSWVEFQDVPTNGAGSGVASDFNVNGGHIRVAAGRPTGNATGGTAGFQIANGVDQGENTKQILVDALTVDADNGGSETFVLIRDNAGNMLRVGIGATDSAGIGFRTLRVPN